MISNFRGLTVLSTAHILLLGMGTTFLFIRHGTGYPISENIADETHKVTHQTPDFKFKQLELKNQSTSKNTEDLDEKKTRLLNFLNNLNTLSGLFNPIRNGGIKIPGTTNNNANTNNGVIATTPRLNGRPGLGFIPDITKGVNTILNGVASGNLEQILEGSFVFAPNNVQWVAGGVLDRVFMSTPPTSSPQNKASGSSTTVKTKEIFTQEQLLEIIKLQQEQINKISDKNKMSQAR